MIHIEMSNEVDFDNLFDEEMEDPDLEDVADDDSPGNIDPTKHVIIAGRTQSGKTTLARAIIYFYALTGLFSRFYAFVPSADQQELYNFLPRKYIFTKPKPKDLFAIIDDQKRRYKLARGGNYTRVCIVLDDFIGEDTYLGSKKTNNNKLLDDIATKGSKYNITCLFLTQNLNSISTTLKGNIYYLYITGRLYENSIKMAHLMYGGELYASLSKFRAYINKTCKLYKTVLLTLQLLKQDESYEPITILLSPENQKSFKLNF